MKLEFLDSGSPDCPLLRLYGFSAEAAKRLFEAMAQLADGAADNIAVHGMPGVEAIGGCRLVLLARPWDQGIVRVAGPCNFECGFTRESWDNIAGLVEPFARGVAGFQWLAGTPGEARLLLSSDGNW